MLPGDFFSGLLGISEQTFYRWKAKWGGMEVDEARRLRQLEEENRRLMKGFPARWNEQKATLRGRDDPRLAT